MGVNLFQYKTISHLAFTANVFVIVNVIVYYDVKLQKNIEMCKKIHYIFRAITVNNGQCRSKSVNNGQRLTSSSYLCIVLERGNQQVESPESTR